VKVRRARAEDVAAMAAVAAASYREAFAPILGEAAVASRDAEFFERRFVESWPSMRVAVVGARIVGFSLVSDRHIDMLFVAPGVTGRGAGSALLARAEREGARTLECFRDNTRARSFYEKHGWRWREEYVREFAGVERDFVLYARGPG
jgi:putative acetyltransferase